MSGRRAGCPGVRGGLDVRAVGGGCSGSESGTDTMNSTGKIATPGQNSDKLVDGNRGRDGEKLDQLDTKQIRGSNPTKLHHTNKSQKKLGLFLVGIFKIRTKQQNQARKHGVGLQKCDQRGS